MLKLPLWARLLLRLPCPRFPQRLSNWEGLFSSAGATIFLVLFFFFELWLGAEVSSITSIVLLRWLIMLVVPLTMFIVWLRIELERAINYMHILL